MTEQIEIFDQKRKKYRGGHIIGIIVFFFAWLLRCVIKIFELEMETFHTVVFVFLILSVLFMAYFAIRFNIIEINIRKDSILKEALHNELVRLNRLKAWKIAFLSIVIFLIIVAILSAFVQINDFMLIFVTALLVGFGACNITIHILDR